MDPYKANMGMAKPDYNAMRGQGFYNMGDSFGSTDPNYYSHLPIDPSQMGFGAPSGPTGFEGLIPPNDQNMNYYQEYCRLFIANVVLTTQMKELIAEKNELLTRLGELENRSDKPVKENSSPLDKKSARLRRKAAEIERHYKCPVTTCQKSYGAEGTLMQHVRLKHPDFAADPEWKLKLQKEGGSEVGSEDKE